MTLYSKSDFCANSEMTLHSSELYMDHWVKESFWLVNESFRPNWMNGIKSILVFANILNEILFSYFFIK